MVPAARLPCLENTFLVLCHSCLSSASCIWFVDGGVWRLVRAQPPTKNQVSCVFSSLSSKTQIFGKCYDPVAVHV